MTFQKSIQDLNLTMSKDGRKVILKIHSRGENGKCLFSDTVNLNSASARSSLVKKLGSVQGMPAINDVTVLEWQDEYEKWLQSQEDEDEDLIPFVFSVRQKTAFASEGEEIPVENPESPEVVQATFRQLVENISVPLPDVLMSWPKAYADTLTVVDVDYHHLPNPPDPDYITTLAEAVRPRPMAWWISHGGGLHLVYIRIPPYTARELAACADLSIRAMDPTATIDHITTTRHPLSERSDS